MYNLNYKLIYRLCFAAAVLLAGCTVPTEKRLPSLEESFSRADKNPFGTFIAYRQLEAMFYRNNVREKKQPFTKTWNDINDTAALYVCLAPNLLLNEDEAKAMLDYVYAGNTLFVAANTIDDNLLKEIQCKQNFSFGFYYNFFDSLRTTNTTTTDTAFSYYYQPFKNSFTYRDSTFTKVLGVNDRQQPNFILYYHGKGKLLLHCDPRAFSNYFLLKDDNYKYMQHAFSYTSDYPDHIYWDDFYRKVSVRRRRSNASDDDSSFSSLNVILSHNELAWAFWLSLLLLLLFLAFSAKRRQRIIEKLKPNENSTVTFAETIGRLYLQKKDNKNIAEKMVTYFNEFVRNKYFVNTNNINSDFITTLSRKSGVEKDKVESLYRAIQHVNNNPAVDDYQLLSLNEQIQQFYKK